VPSCGKDTRARPRDCGFFSAVVATFQILAFKNLKTIALFHPSVQKIISLRNVAEVEDLLFLKSDQLIVIDQMTLALIRATTKNLPLTNLR
jgi:hypothetical protein